MTKIVIIGAGSASFGPTILSDIMQSDRFEGSTVALCDLNEQGLELMTRLAERLNQEWRAGVSIEASTDRRTLLPDAEFVIVSIAVDREKCWRQDWEIPLKYGIRQPLGENGGPGALFHTCRNAPAILAICEDMEELCPQAWLLNFTNPVPRMALVAQRYSDIRAVGLCHQIGMGYNIVALTLADDLGYEVELPENEWGMYYITPWAHEVLDIKAAGLNHFTFMLDICHRDTGEDLYPLFADRIEAMPAHFQPLSRRIFDAFGLFPATGDGHLAEYIPWAHDAQTRPWEKYHLHLYDWDAAEEERDRMWQGIEQMVAGGPLSRRVMRGSGERAIPVILGVMENRNSYEDALNIPNEGYIANLPQDSIVEVPAVVSRFGIRGVSVGELPEGLASLCQTQITVATLAVDAAILGDRDLALEALLVDPMVNDMDMVRSLLEEMLELQAEYLPQFTA